MILESPAIERVSLLYSLWYSTWELCSPFLTLFFLKSNFHEKISPLDIPMKMFLEKQIMKWILHFHVIY